MSHPVYGLNELREMFLRFFESKGHLRLPSFSLIPQNDKSILLINAGMTPMKPWFKGEEEPPRRRVCTCQKCIRTGDICTGIDAGCCLIQDQHRRQAEHDSGDTQQLFLSLADIASDY